LDAKPPASKKSGTKKRAKKEPPSRTAPTDVGDVETDEGEVEG
jgi:hypothetical protein